jgi:hypothetical protein
MSDSRRPTAPTPPARAPYEPPDVQVVRVDPVTELLQGTNCNRLGVRPAPMPCHPSSPGAGTLVLAPPSRSEYPA